jgi:4-alpha-glucanotransferase
MDVFAKAAQLGIETSYVDAGGTFRAVDPAALEILVGAIPPSPRHPFLNSTFICRGHAPHHIEISDQAALPIVWRATKESEGPSGIVSDRQLTLPELEDGIYSLTVTDAQERHDHVPLLSVPSKAFSGNFDKVWLLAVQLYSVRSQENWGVGDFSDLAALVRWASEAGAAGVGLNPLHVLFDNYPQDCSPYSPNSRLFLNPVYIDVTRAPGFAEEFLTGYLTEIDDARSASFVDYVKILPLKLKVLRLAFATFKKSPADRRHDSFKAFRRERGSLLNRFACFEILRQRHSGPWWDWPKDASRWSEDLHKDVERTDAAELEFIAFVQWCADQQLKACRDLARDLKLPVGLYLDVAVGVKADGFDAWNEQIAISRSLSVGAPPDLLNTAGQNWGLAGFSASGLELTSYVPFRQMLESSMRYSGAIRIDHILGLNRIYVVPNGYRASDGAYIRMPLEALLGLIALESDRHRCVVIGEDLGTVPDGFRDRMEDWNVWTYRVMIFERGHDGSFIAPHHYPTNSLATFNTHDLPSFSGWLSHHDLALKRSLGIDPGESHEARDHAVRMLSQALHHAHLGDLDVYSALGLLARANSRIMSIAIDDLLGVIEQPNIPGTMDEHPNWRRRLPVSMEAWSGHIDLARLRSVLGSRSHAVSG